MTEGEVLIVQYDLQKFLLGVENSKYKILKNKIEVRDFFENF